MSNTKFPVASGTVTCLFAVIPDVIVRVVPVVPVLKNEILRVLSEVSVMKVVVESKFLFVSV